MKVCTTSSRWGRIVSNLSKSPNSYCSRVGHQQMARFLLSMQLILLLSDTLYFVKSKICKHSIFTHLTKCWKRNLSTAWFDRGSLSRSFLTSRSLICLSPITAICSKSVMCSWIVYLISDLKIIFEHLPEVRAEAGAWRRSPWQQWPQHWPRCPETRY